MPRIMPLSSDAVRMRRSSGLPYADHQAVSHSQVRKVVAAVDASRSPFQIGSSDSHPARSRISATFMP